MYECFHCGARAVIWDCDYSFEDFCYEGEGIVQVLHCTNCGAEIEYRIYLEDEDDEQRGDQDTSRCDRATDIEG